MTEDELRKWIPLLGSTPIAEEGAEWIHTSCPLAFSTHQHGTDSSPSMGFRVGPGESHVHCFACMYSGTQMDLVLELQRLKVKAPWDKLIGGINAAIEEVPFGWEDGSYEQIFEKTDNPFPETLVEDITEPAYFDGEVHPYLAGRGIAFKTAEDWDLRFDPWRERIVVPVRDLDGRLMGLHGRSVNGLSKLKYLMYPHEKQTNPHILLGEHKASIGMPLVIAESMFDLFAVYPFWFNVVSPLKAGISAQTIKRLEGITTIVTLFDADKAGDKGREKVEKHASACVHHLVPPAEMDAGDMDPEELKAGLYALLDKVYCADSVTL